MTNPPYEHHLLYSVRVTDNLSLWNNSSILYVGYLSGDNNQLIVTNGGTVYSSAAFVGYASTLGTNNFVIVTGQGSSWNITNATGDLTVSRLGWGNQLTISDGVANRGAIAPYFSAGSLTFTSNLVLGASSVI